MISNKAKVSLKRNIFSKIEKLQGFEIAKEEEEEDIPSPETIIEKIENSDSVTDVMEFTIQYLKGVKTIPFENKLNDIGDRLSKKVSICTRKRVL